LFSQDLVFKSKFDGTLKTSLKNSLTVVDALDSEPIRQIWEVIETKSAALAAVSSPLVDLPTIQELDVGDDDLVVMSAVFAADRLEAMSSDNRDLVKDAAEGAKRIVAAGVRLIDGEDKESTLIAAIRDGPISRIQGVVTATSLSSTTSSRRARTPATLLDGQRRFGSRTSIA